MAENKYNCDHLGKPSIFRKYYPWLIFSGIGVLVCAIIGFFMEKPDALSFAGIGVGIISMTLGAKEWQKVLEIKVDK